MKTWLFQIKVCGIDITRLVFKWFKRKNKAMCLNWFKKKPTPEPIVPATKRAILFGDNYPGTSYALCGCVNDIIDVESKLKAEFTGYDILRFKNSECTISNFYNTIKSALLVGRPGDFLIIWYSGHGTQIPDYNEPDGYSEALYLHDGPFSDDRLLELQQMTPDGMIVNANFDSCFSGGMAKGFCTHTRNKFHQMPGVAIRKNRTRKIGEFDSKWVINAGSSEAQTSSDADFGGRANGAFTYFDLKCWTVGTTFRQEMTNMKRYLPGNGFDQIPLLIGNSSLFDEKYR